MLVVIFSYNRDKMLTDLMLELSGFVDVVVIDDGSNFTASGITSFSKSTVQLIRTPHEGKKGFWKKWVMARQIALGSSHDYFLFLPDDITDLNLDAIKEITSQGWDESLFAVNVINCGRSSCWGRHQTGQEDIALTDVDLKEVGFVDCGFLTNRYTMKHIDIHEVNAQWFNRPDKSSGVGYQLTTSMRAIGTKMLMPFPGLCYHGEHESQMHGEFRKEVPLTSKKND